MDVNDPDFERVSKQVDETTRSVINAYLQGDNKEFEKKYSYDDPNHPVNRQALQFTGSSGKDASDYISHEIMLQTVLKEWGVEHNFQPSKFLEIFLAVTGPEMLIHLASVNEEKVDEFSRAMMNEDEAKKAELSEWFLNNFWTPQFQAFEEDKREYLREYVPNRSNIIFTHYMSEHHGGNNPKGMEFYT